MPRVTVTNSSPEGRIARASNPDWRVRRSGRARRRVDILEGNILSVVGDDVGGPGLSDYFEIFVGDRASPIERHTESLEFLFGPSYPHAKDEASAAQLIDIGCDSCGLKRVAVWKDRDAGSELDLARLGSEP